MAIAGGIAKVFGDLSARNWYFRSGSGGDNVDGIKAISSSWTANQATGRITWNGADPEFTAGGARNPSNLFIGTSASSMLDDDIVCNIPHAAVSLQDGDTIIYTAVHIDFTT